MISQTAVLTTNNRYLWIRPVRGYDKIRYYILGDIKKAEEKMFNRIEKEIEKNAAKDKEG